MKGTDLVLIGAVAVGGYFLYKMFKTGKFIVEGTKEIITGPGELVTAFTGAFTGKSDALIQKDPAKYGKTVAEVGKTFGTDFPSTILNDPVGTIFKGYQELPNLITIVTSGKIQNASIPVKSSPEIQKARSVKQTEAKTTTQKVIIDKLSQSRIGSVVAVRLQQTNAQKALGNKLKGLV